MGNALRAAGVDRKRQRGIRAMLVCAVLATAAAVWVTAGRPPRRAAPAAVVPPRQSWQAPAAAPPTADEEGGRTALLPPAVPARNRLEQPRQRPRPGAAGVRPHHTVEPALSARYRTARPLSPAHEPDRTQPAGRSGAGGRESPDPASAAAPPRPTPADSSPRRSDQTPAVETQAATGRAPLPGAAEGGAASTGRAGSGGSGSTGDGARSGSGPAPATGGDDGAAGAAAAPPAQLLPPRVITFAGTDYPGDAFRVTVERQELGSTLVYRGTEGNVRVRALVRADGRLGSVEVAASSGSPILDRAATEAVRRWVFAPATRNGVPLDAYVTFTIRYVVR